MTVIEKIEKNINVLLYTFKNYKEGEEYVATYIINTLINNKAFKNLILNTKYAYFEEDSIIFTCSYFGDLVVTFKINDDRNVYFDYSRKHEYDLRYDINIMTFLLEIYNNNLEELNSNLEKCLFLVL